ncbi:MAG: ABC transporter ATP-binding protein [Acidimicrobiales bacterium]
MLEIDGVVKRYGEVEALRGVDLAVGDGEIVALLGRNGAGKSTLLSVIAGLTEPDEGRVCIGGHDPRREPAAASRLLGVAPQDTGIYPSLTVAQNLEFFGELHGLTRRDARARAVDVAEQLGLADLLGRQGRHLSGGEARRLHAACALLHRPRLLLLDEPTVGADVATRRQLIDAVQVLAAEGTTVIYTTHYLPEVEALGAEVVIIDGGRMLARGTQRDLVARYHRPGFRVGTDGPLDPGVLDELTIDLEALDHAEYRVDGVPTLAGLLAAFGPHADRIESVDTLRPDLEAVFLAVTGADLAALDANDEVTA